MRLEQDQGLTGDTKLNRRVESRFSRRDLLVGGTVAAASLLLSPALMAQSAQPKFSRVPTQYIAALGDPDAKSGSNAQDWGLWRLDPGPRGVRLSDYDKLQGRGSVAPANWTFDNEDWWLEENGLIMEEPEFPLPAGFYRVTGDREVTAVLTVHDKGSDGTQRWELDNSASIYDVTHLRCRSGRYTPATSEEPCSPANASQSNFPVTPGAEMPAVDGCSKQDYAVFIVTAIASL